MEEANVSVRDRAVDVLLGFVNTHADAGGQVEQFGDGESFAGWLRSHGCGSCGSAGERSVVTGADAAAARELRDALIAVMLAHSGHDGAGHDGASGDGVAGRGAEEAEALLREAARRYPLVPVITADGVRLTSEQRGVPFVLGCVLAAVTELALGGAWRRVKACRNPLCQHGFLDRTRNGSGAYCSAACRSRMSMRALRQRRKHA